MSNFIKSNSVLSTSIKTKPIDVHLKKEAEILIKQKEARMKKDKTNKIISKEELASELLDKAKRQSEEILSDALNRAQNIEREAFLEGFNKGYEDGNIKANKELVEKEENLKRKENELINKYEQLYNKLEPKFAGLVIELVKKLTGIIVDDFKEVTIYSIKTTIGKMDRSKKYSIRLSLNDYPYISSRKNEIESLFDKDIQIEIKADASLEDNACIIETENQVFDCGINVQLENLFKSLDLISKL